MRGLAAAMEIRHGGTRVIFCFWARAPVNGGKCRGQPGSCGPALQQTPVGDDACIVPGMFAVLQGPAGWACPSPTNLPNMTRETEQPQPTRAAVGRDAPIPPHPAPPQCSAGGPWPSPTNRGKHGGPAGKHKPRGQPPSPCRGAHRAPGRPFRHAAFFKRQPAAGQSLRHGLRPCHLPLTREANPPHPCAPPVGDDARIVPGTPRRRQHPGRI